jgi:NADH:ubiquinone reductase (H+-translocating)
LLVPQVVILGAGYAGAHAARRARAEGAEVTVVDPDGHHAFTPRFAAVAAGRAAIGDLAAPIDGLLDVEVVADLAVAIDTDARTIGLAGGGGLPYEALVVTTGAEAATPSIDGLTTHARALATVTDTLAIRDTVRRLATGAEAAPTSDLDELDAHATPGSSWSVVAPPACSWQRRSHTTVPTSAWSSSNVSARCYRPNLAPCAAVPTAS